MIENSNTSIESSLDEYKSYSFLFDADASELSYGYGSKCNQLLLECFQNIGVLDKLDSWFFIGDVIISKYCENINSVSKKGSTMSMSYSYNKDMGNLIVAELINSLHDNFHTFNIRRLTSTFFTNNIYCITLSSFNKRLIEMLNSKLKEEDYYLGLLEPDFRHPLHRALFINLKNYYFKAGILFYKEFYGCEMAAYPDWGEKSGIQILGVNEFEMESRFNKIQFSTEISELGEKFQNKIKQKGELNHRKQLATELFFSKLSEDFEFITDNGVSIKDAEVSKSKLYNYALNPEHLRGKEKAKLFKELLGIEREHWKYLAAQLIEGISKGEIEGLKIDEYGIKYHILIPIKGLNGQSKIVRTAWIARDDKIISLTSAYIEDKKKQNSKVGSYPPVVTDHLNTPLYWKSLYDLANKVAERAASSYISIPRFISGFDEPFEDHEFGFSQVVVNDARTEFSRWLKVNNIGRKNSKSGWCIISPSSLSYHRAKVYAEEFAKVLDYNEVSCSVESFLD
ncbi:MAG: hypothetical protein JZU53_16540 [Paludibacter sp.]|jgi:hypothetical protein|nr:hypothetical protein [Paludibacter sp.]